jgi:NAD(P)-dependent dehydrogenase (short-subunit alcohol dehydrogenase family)
MTVSELVDDALEILVVPSFSRWGYAIRRRLFDWQDPGPEALAGRTALVTGPTSGLGRSIAGSLAGLGARVVLVGRNADRLDHVRRELSEAAGEDRFPTVIADLSSRRSVLRAVDRLLASEERLDVLVDNAGGLFDERRETVEGIELTLALMVVGPFVLTSGLLPLLRAHGGRVIVVTSGGMYTQAVRLDDIESGDAEPWSGARVYARAKRIQVAMVREWARRTEGANVTFNAMHPGWADTPGLAESLPAFRRLMAPILRSPREGADTAVWLAASEEARAWNGRLFLDRRPRPFDRIPSTRLGRAERAALWDAVVDLAGIADPGKGPDGRRLDVTHASSGDRVRHGL